MSNVEHGAGFHPKNGFDFSPVHILPIGGGPVEITQELRKQEFSAVTVIPSDKADAHGILHYRQTKDKVALSNGEAIVPDGAKISIAAYGVFEPILLTVSKKDGVAVAIDPNTSEFPFVLQGTSEKNGMKFPKNKPQFVAWNEPEQIQKQTVNGTVATEILGGFNVEKLVLYRLLSPDQTHKHNAFRLTGLDIIRSFVIQTVLEENTMKLSEVKSRMITPYTEERLLHIIAKPEWNAIVERAKAYNLDLKAEMDGLFRSVRSYTNSTQRTLGKSF